MPRTTGQTGPRLHGEGMTLDFVANISDPSEDPEDLGAPEPAEDTDVPFSTKFRRAPGLIPNVLNNEDAAEHVRSYQRGLAATKKLSRTKPLSDTQTATARRDAAAGEVAAQKLIESMLKLSTRIVREIAEARHGREGAAALLEDLLSEANLAVLEAAKSFDPSKDVGFSRWAAQQVRNTIRTLVMEDNASGFKIYSSWARIRRRAIPERHDLSVKLGREPTMTELKEHMVEVCLEWAYDHLKPSEQRLSPAKRRDAAMSKLRKQGTLSAIENLEDALNAGAHPVRLDTPVGDDEDSSTWGSLLPADEDPNKAHSVVASRELRELLMKSLQPLSDREQTIILYRFGFVDGEVWTYRAIGDMFSISAERVRQIEEHARTFLRTESEFAEVLVGHLRD